MMRRAPQIPMHTTNARVAVGVCALLVVASLSAMSPAGAAAPPAAGATFVDLGTAASYSVLAGAGVTNTGNATVLAGDLGLSPSGVIAGFPPGTTMGTIHDKDAAAEQAQSDRQDAYDAAAAQTSTGAFSGDQAGATFTSGVYTSAAAITNTGTMTLNAEGDSGAVFVFQVGAAFSSAAASKIVLTNGALANNVYWQVLGAVAIGAGAKVVGTFLGAGAISFGEGASIKGRALTPSTVSLANSPFAVSKDDLTPPLITIDGGSARSVNDTTPAISGTTDEPAGRPLTVTEAGHSLTTTVDAGGLWSVGPAPLAEGDHVVVATISDASQNTSTATQVLTVDVTAPLVSIDGGTTRWTNDETPTIAGTTDQSGDAPVTVTVGGQTLTTTAGVDGHWIVAAAPLRETAYSVVASVNDAAGNTGRRIQVLTVDVTKPVVTIDGGASRSTKDTSPWTYGTSGEKAGSTVKVTVGGQALTTAVISGGTWGVSAENLKEGTHQLVASITDDAGNTGTAIQTLTIGDNPTDPGTHYQPDAAIRRGNGDFVGAGTYGGSADQRLTAHLHGKAKSATFEIRLTNSGNAADTFVLRGKPTTKKFKVTYRVGGKNATKAITAGTYRTHIVKTGANVRVLVRITLTAAARPGDKHVFELRATSSHAPTKRDTVAAAARH